MMGLSAFEENSNPSFYCSSSIDRSLTKRLIDCSNNPLKISSSCFAHSPEWADGLDIWSSSQTSTTKPENSRRQFDFHRDLGLYLPRHEKPNSAPISSKNLHHHSTPTITQLPPERLRILIRREKDFLLQNDLSNPPVIIDHQPPLSLPPPPTNSLRLCSSFFFFFPSIFFCSSLLATSVEIPSTNEVRLPLRHIPTKPKSPPPVPLPPSQPPKLNQDTLKSLLKEHLTSLLTRGASTVNAHRSVINAPSFDIRQQIRTDPKLMEERFAKLDEFIPTQQMKNSQPSPPPLIFYQRSTLGLTVTPVDLCTQRNTQMVSLEKMAQQRTIFTDSDCSSVNSSRPSTQPGHYAFIRIEIKSLFFLLYSSSPIIQSCASSTSTATCCSSEKS